MTFTRKTMKADKRNIIHVYLDDSVTEQKLIQYGIDNDLTRRILLKRASSFTGEFNFFDNKIYVFKFYDKSLKGVSIDANLVKRVSW